jgi:hypothetical protein
MTTKNTEEVVEAMDVDNPTQNVPPPATSKSRRKSRGKGVDLEDETMLRKISWSKLSQPEADLANLIEEGSVIVAGYDSERSAWIDAERPACSDCARKHPPPCLSSEALALRHTHRQLLKAYMAESKAALQAEQTTSADSTTKGKGKATTAATAQKDAPTSESKSEDGKEEEKSSTKKKSKRKLCDCGRYHKGECNIPTCAKCGAKHWPTQPCTLSDNRSALWAAMFAECKSPEAASALGKLFNDTYSSSSGGAKKNDGKRKNATQDDDPDEGSSTGTKRKK